MWIKSKRGIKLIFFLDSLTKIGMLFTSFLNSFHLKPTFTSSTRLFQNKPTRIIGSAIQRNGTKELNGRGDTQQSLKGFRKACESNVVSFEESWLQR